MTILVVKGFVTAHRGPAFSDGGALDSTEFRKAIATSEAWLRPDSTQAGTTLMLTVTPKGIDFYFNHFKLSDESAQG